MSNESTDKVEESAQPTAEEVAAQAAVDQKEAEDAFAAGFKNIRKDYEPTPDLFSKDDKASAEEKPAEKKPEVKAEKPKPAKEKSVEKPAADPFRELEEKLNNRLRSLEGHYGGIMTKLNEVTAPAAAAKQQPTQKEVQKAIADPDAMARLVKEFPEFLPIQAELSSIRQAISEMPKELPKQPAIDPIEIRETVKLDALHPDWEEVAKSESFFAYSLEGGPPHAEYARLRQTEETDPTGALRTINSWAQQFPQWWADKGYALFSTRAADSSKLITKYKEHSSRAAEEQSKQEQEALKKSKNQQRLDRATTPNGLGGAPDTGVSDSEAFKRGFKKIIR